MTWRPISEAPKDGTPILVWDGEQCAVVAWGGIIIPNWLLLEGGGKPYPGCETEWEDATHFMPLPPAPGEK